MINRDDMMELTRRMTISRTSFTRIAGCYIDSEGYIDGTFNTNFPKLSTHEKATKLEVAKTILFSNTNENLKEYKFTNNSKENVSMWKLLNGMKSCGLKNDAMMDIFYEVITERYKTNKEYGIFVFHDRYDVPMKASDKERLGESEEVHEYIICAICPIDGDYEPGVPEFGFVYPMFSDRSTDINHIGIFNRNKERVNKEIQELLLNN